MKRRVDQQRAAGRHRAAQFPLTYQRAQAKKRVAQPSFLAHNRRIAPDGHSAISAAMRAACGIRLLRPEHVQFLRPEQLRGPQGTSLSEEQQRLCFGLYVWKAVWEYLAPQPEPPTDQEFLAQVMRVRSRLACGLPLEQALDVIYAAPNDFCDATGLPWAPRKQRKLFREAFRAARAAAEAQLGDLRHQAQAERTSRPLGRRRPMSAVPLLPGQVKGGQRR